MESEDSTRDSGGMDDFELMCVVAQTIISNSNVVLMRYLSRRHKSQQLRNQQALLDQLVFQHIRGIYQDDPKPSLDTMMLFYPK
jgi:hypothetical protein